MSNLKKVVKCIKCICGCNALSEDRLKELISKDVHSFLNDKVAVDMFIKFIPKDSPTHATLNVIQQAKQFYEIDYDDDSDEWEQFADNLYEHLEEELRENPDTKAVLDKIIFEYSKKIECSIDFKNFNSNLREKYKKITKKP